MEAFMSRLLRWSALLVLSASVLPRAATACDQCKLNKQGLYFGEFRILGDGTVRSWVQLGKDNKPAAMGVTLSETALRGLETTPAKTPAEMMKHENPLTLPRQAAATGFDHISVDWNPQGHDPKGIYDKPHFDFHFYRISQAARDQITATGKDLAKCDKLPSKRFIPAGYILAPKTEFPRMGAHWVDPTSPELTGKLFTSTFIYGSYDGKLNFIEPMVTKAFLESKPNFTAPVKVPAAYEKPGYYPTRYSVKYDETRQEITIALEGLKYFAGQAGKGKKKLARQ
jgi:hypothetical protein